jgi:hypothetical protein
MITTLIDMPDFPFHRARPPGPWGRIIGAARAWGRRVLLLGLLTALAACSSVRLAYNQGPMLTDWWVGRYVDLDRAQSARLDQALASWWHWHRSNELPEYAQWLEASGAGLAQPVPAAVACSWAQGWQDRADRALTQALPDLAALALSLRPAQVAQLAQRLDKRQREQEEDAQGLSEAQWRDKQAERWVSRYQDFYGDLNPAQQARLAQAADTLVPTRDALAQEQWARQQALLDMLRQFSANAITAQAAQAPLQAWVSQWWDSPRPAWHAWQVQAKAGHCALFEDLHRLASPAQRAVAVKRVRAWEEDARVLSHRG